MTRKKDASNDNNTHVKKSMSEKEREAWKRMEERNKELKEHRHSRGQDKENVPINAVQIESDKSLKLENGTYKNAVVCNLDTPIKAVEYDKREKESKEEEEEFQK